LIYPHLQGLARIELRQYRPYAPGRLGVKVGHQVVEPEQIGLGQCVIAKLVARIP